MKKMSILTALTVTAGLVGTGLASAAGYWRHPGYMPPPPPPPSIRAPFGAPHVYRGIRPVKPHHNLQPGRYVGAGANTATSHSPAQKVEETVAAGSTPSVVLPDTGDVMVSASGAGNILTDSRGMTLYTYSQDQNGRSDCSGSCAKSWPPVIAGSGARAAGDFSLVKRGDGSLQWAYEGRPLYTWIADRNPGDVKGDDVGRVWQAARL